MWLRPIGFLSLLVFIVKLVSATHGNAQAPTVRFVDDQGKTLAEVEYSLHQEHTYLPIDVLKTVFDPDISSQYQRPRKQLILNTKDKEIRLRMGNPKVNVGLGEQTVTLTIPPLVIQGQPMLPIDFFRRILPHLDDVDVLYNPDLQRIRIIPKTVWEPEEADNTREWVVFIDPGHGGEDDLGCKSQNGVFEKDVVLAVAKEIQAQSHQYGLTVHLTRENDTNKTRMQRIQAANRNHGQLFLSLHCNASFSPNQEGIRLYINNPNGQPRFKTTTIPVFGKNRINILTQINYLKQSTAFATLLQNEMNFFVEDPIVISEFPVIALKDVNMPAVLLELGYLSNIEDANRLSNPDHITELGKSVIRAIQSYSASIRQEDNTNTHTVKDQTKFD